MSSAIELKDGILNLEKNLANVFLPLTVHDIGRTSRFSADFDSRDLGYCRITRAHITAQKFYSTLSSVAQATPERYVLRYMSRGTVWFGGDGLDLTARKGSFLLLSQARHFEVRHTGISSSTSIALPGGLLKGQIREIDALCFKPVYAAAGAGNLLKKMMTEIWNNRESLSYDDSKSVAGSVTHLVRAVFQPLATELSGDANTHSGRAEEMERTIEYYLDRDGLNADFVAKKMGISKRYLSAIAAHQGTTLGKMVLSRRLERCREDLFDPARADQSITDIAFSWGFKDISHFSHRFSECFGVSPSSYRKQSGVHEPS